MTELIEIQKRAEGALDLVKKFIPEPVDNDYWIEMGFTCTKCSDYVDMESDQKSDFLDDPICNNCLAQMAVHCRDLVPQMAQDTKRLARALELALSLMDEYDEIPNHRAVARKAKIQAILESKE